MLRSKLSNECPAWHLRHVFVHCRAAFAAVTLILSERNDGDGCSVRSDNWQRAHRLHIHWLNTNMFVVHACTCTSLVRLPRYDSVSCRPYSVPARPYITGKRYARQCNLKSQRPNFANAISVGYCPVDALVRRWLRHLPLHSRLRMDLIGGSSGTPLFDMPLTESVSS
jgi:hypothetical protein